MRWARHRLGFQKRPGPPHRSAFGLGYKPPERRKGSGRKRGAQPGHPGSGPELLPIERVDEVVEHHPEACRRCGTLLQGNDPEPLRHQVIEIPPITPVVTVFLQGLSRSTAAAIELLGSAFEGIVVSDRFSAYNHLPVEQRQLCWAHLIRDLSAIAERQGVSGEIGRELLALQQQLFVQWHQWKDGAIDWPTLQLSCWPLRQRFEGTLQRVVDLGLPPKERTPWAQTVRTCQQLLLRKEALWTFLEVHGIEPTNNAAERALRKSVIQRKISLGVQSASGAICRSRLLTITTSLRQQERDIWQFLEQAWIAHHRRGVMPSLLPVP